MDHTPLPQMPVRPSVVDPVSSAFDWTNKVLFRPFDLNKWFTLGFCAWLAWIGQGGGGGGGSNWNLPDDDSRFGTDAIGDWFHDNTGLFIAIAGVSVLVILGLVVLFTWLSSRGKLMFLDGVVHNRGAVKEPWRRYRELGNSLFGFRIVLVVCAGIIFTILIGAMILSLIALGINSDNPGPLAIMALVLWILVVVVTLAIGFALIAMAINDFIVPIMWLRNRRVMDAWPEFRSLLSGNFSTFFVYALMKIVLGLGIGIITCVLTCITCCVAALPYIGTVILLPLFVFRRSYSMHFLSQFGPDYAVLGPADAPAPAPPAPPAAPPEIGGATP